MFRTVWRFLVIAVALAALAACGTSQADACWGCYSGAYWGNAPVYTTYSPCCATVSCGCDTCCDTCCGGYYLGYRPGPLRRAVFGPYRWYAAGCGTCCGGDACSSCGSTVGCDCGGVTVTAAAPAEPTPAQEPAPSEAPTPAAPLDMPSPAAEEPPVTAPDTLMPNTFMPGTSFAPTPANSGLLTIWVPNDAKVTINGLETRSTGSRRVYVSHGLQPGFNYKYEVHAEVVRDGRVVEDVKTVTMTAGGRSVVAFGFNISPAQNLASNL